MFQPGELGQGRCSLSSSRGWHSPSLAVKFGRPEGQRFKNSRGLLMPIDGPLVLGTKKVESQKNGAGAQLNPKKEGERGPGH